MIRALLVISILTVIFSCGVREDPYYFSCDGSDNCKEITQSELAMFIETEKEPYLNRQCKFKSGENGRDRNTVQSYIVNYKAKFQYGFRDCSPSSGVNHFVGKEDASLSCNFESFYGVVKEEGDRYQWDLKIYGVFRRSGGFYSCPYSSTYDSSNGGDVLIYSDF